MAAVPTNLIVINGNLQLTGPNLALIPKGRIYIYIYIYWLGGVWLGTVALPLQYKALEEKIKYHNYPEFRLCAI